MIKTMELNPVREFKGLFQPIMFVKSMKCSDDLSPIWYAFATLCGISYDCSSFENKYVDVIFCKSLGACCTCRASTYDDDLTVLNFHLLTPHA
jgi:uncharacterized protein (DUF779 family)